MKRISLPTLYVGGTKLSLYLMVIIMWRYHFVRLIQIPKVLSPIGATPNMFSGALVGALDFHDSKKVVRSVGSKLEVGWIEVIGSKLASVESKLASVESNLASVESNLASVESNLASVESNLASVESNLASVEPNLASVESNLEVGRIKF